MAWKNTLWVILGAGLSALIILGVLLADIQSALTIAIILVLGSTLVTLFRINQSAEKQALSMGAHPLDLNDEYQKWLSDMVHSLAQKADLPSMPVVGYIPSDGINAFALGRPGDSAVLFFAGLLNRLPREEIEAIAAHEITHIAMGDSLSKTGMLAAIQGMTYILLAPLYILLFVVSMFVNNNLMRYFTVWVGSISIRVVGAILGFIGFVVTMWFSRLREYAADAGGARLTSPQAMAKALSSIERCSSSLAASKLDPLTSTLCINNTPAFLGTLFSTHPSIPARVKALEDISQQ